MSVHGLMVVVAIAITVMEFQNLLSWWRGKTLSPATEPSEDFTLIVPLYGHPRFFDGRAGLLRYQRNTLVALECSSELMQAFARELEGEGWRVLRLQMDGPNPARLMVAGLEHVDTTIAIRLDADTLVGDDLAHAVTAVLEDGADLCSVKVEVDSPQTVAQKLQALEYRVSMLARHFR